MFYETFAEGFVLAGLIDVDDIAEATDRRSLDFAVTDCQMGFELGG